MTLNRWGRRPCSWVNIAGMPDATAPLRWTEYQPVAGLVPAVRNPKGHDQEAMGRSVEQFGFIEPVVLDERTGRLLAGHGRVEWLQAQHTAGAEPPDGVMVGDDGGWQWLVVRGIHSRDDLHADAMGIALNRVGERGGWKPDTLAEMLDEMADAPMLVAAAGFSADELDDLIAGAAGAQLPTPEFEPDPDGADGQPRLDVRNPIVCPKCNHHFHRS